MWRVPPSRVVIRSFRRWRADGAGSAFLGSAFEMEGELDPPWAFAAVEARPKVGCFLQRRDRADNKDPPKRRSPRARAKSQGSGTPAPARAAWPQERTKKSAGGQCGLDPERPPEGRRAPGPRGAQRRPERGNTQRRVDTRQLLAAGIFLGQLGPGQLDWSAQTTVCDPLGPPDLGGGSGRGVVHAGDRHQASTLVEARTVKLAQPRRIEARAGTCRAERGRGRAAGGEPAPCSAC